MEYGGSLALDPPAPEDEDDIIAALKQSDRVISISLTVTSSLLEKLSAIESPFSELEDLVLLSRDSVLLTLPSTFRWGPRLRCLSSTRIAFPALLRLLYSSTNLVDLQLHEVLYPSDLTPKVLTDALSGMTQLQSLSLHFLSVIYPYPPLPAGERAVLPALTRFNFRGATGYLEGFVAIIDAPRLEDIGITFLDDPIFGDLTLNKFIDRIEMHRSHRRAHILSSQGAVSISLIQLEVPTCLQLRLISEKLSVQLSFVAQVCIHFSTFLFNVEDVCITATRRPGWRGSLRNGQWPELIDSFTGIKQLHVAGTLSRHINWYDVCLVPPLLLAHSFGVGPLSQQVTIGMLSGDILLDIFRHCLGTTPQIWPTLAHVCKRWRQIVLASPLGLNLRLYCTYGTPVSKTMDCWPAFPIVVKYGGFPNFGAPAPGDDDNIIAALKQSGRVCSICLTVTSSLLGKLSAISEPFSELEDLVLLSQDNMQLTLQSTFRWGPRLRTLHSTRIAFPSFPQLLSPSHNLVDIQLHEIPSAGYFSPEAFANALSGITHLRSLSLHFLSLPPRRNYLSLPPLSGERVVLSALMFLKYRGTSKYLDNLVARIDAPHLGNIDITLFSQPTIDSSQLGRFIERTEMQTSLNQADV
ncbi:hypothetical protein EDB83DRAFT_2598454 [Lactarius deliciosus]|nr:hypothetical protein EDB83DRAFT_2598454 [Lactarius deliciosus]